VQVKGVEVGENTAMPRRYRAQGKHVRYWCGMSASRVSVPDPTSKQGGPMAFRSKVRCEPVEQVALAKQKKSRCDSPGKHPRGLAALRSQLEQAKGT